VTTGEPGWQVLFTPLADADVSEAYAHYEAARKGLGEEFLEEVGRAVALIVDHPEACPVVYRALRRALLHRFPYSLYYRIEPADALAEVRAVVHQRRHARTWRRRA
jgi:plasmid stabilization system protein ParE